MEDLYSIFLNAMVVAPLARLIAPKLGLDPADFDTIEEIEDLFPDWEDVLGFDVEALRDALEGNYTGADEFLLGIQTFLAPLRRFLQITTGATDGAGATPSQVTAFFDNWKLWLQGNPIGSDPAGFFTGLANVGQNIIDALLTGYTGSPTTGSAVELEVAASVIENRITALEGGGTLYTCGTSTTLPDLSDKSTFKIWMWASGPGESGRYFAARQYTAAQLDAMGVDLSAIDVVVGAGHASRAYSTPTPACNHSMFGSYGTGQWALQTSDTGSFFVNDLGIFQDVPDGVEGAWISHTFNESIGSGLYRGAGDGRVVVSGTTNYTLEGREGAPGASSFLAAGGTGGVHSTTGHGTAGGSGEDADLSTGAYAGGGQGGQGAGGGVSGTTPRNGGNGGAGGWPGGAPGGPGQRGRYFLFGVESAGANGYWGPGSSGGVIVEVR